MTTSADFQYQVKKRCNFSLDVPPSFVCEYLLASCDLIYIATLCMII